MEGRRWGWSADKGKEEASGRHETQKRWWYSIVSEISKSVGNGRNRNLNHHFLPSYLQLLPSISPKGVSHFTPTVLTYALDNPDENSRRI
eukprot:1327560-Amorphochlora_amoeboformis.AAC.3